MLSFLNKIISSLRRKNYFSYKIVNSGQRPVMLSFLFTGILEILNISENGNPVSGNDFHYNFAFGVFILSLICLLNFINVVGYLTAIILINKYDIETKFPKLKIFIRYFEKSSLFFVILEGIVCLFFLFCIVVFSFLEITIR